MNGLGQGVEDTKDFLAFGDPDALVFFMSLGGIFWGLWLLGPWDVFSSTTTFYSLKTSLFSESTWGMIFVTANAWKFYIWNKFHGTGKYDWKQVLSNFILFALWTVVATNIWMSNWQSAATPIYTFFMLASMWATSQRLAQVKRQRRIAVLQGVEDDELDNPVEGE